MIGAGKKGGFDVLAISAFNAVKAFDRHCVIGVLKIR